MPYVINEPIIIDQADDAVVSIIIPAKLSTTGVVGWDLVVGPTRGAAYTKLYAGTASTIAGITTITWNIPAADTLSVGISWVVARVRYAATKRTFYRAEFQIAAGFNN